MTPQPCIRSCVWEGGDAGGEGHTREGAGGGWWIIPSGVTASPSGVGGAVWREVCHLDSVHVDQGMLLPATPAPRTPQSTREWVAGARKAALGMGREADAPESKAA
jgi:hypothetical protein